MAKKTMGTPSLTKQVTGLIPTAWKKKAVSVLPKQLAKWFKTKTADAYIISFPKCGRTWLRLMIAYAITFHFDQEREVETLNLQRLARLYPQVPKIRVKHDDEPHLQLASGLSHNKNSYRGTKVLFLARDPRDVIVSLYFHRTKRSKDYVGTLSDFVREERGSTEALITYYNIWANNQGVPQDFLLVRYEDLHQNTHQQLRQVLDFLGLGMVGDLAVYDAVEAASFDKMRQLEQSRALSSSRLQPGDEADLDSYKTRRGKVGGYADYLTPSEVAYINEQMKTLLPLYRYL